MSDYEPSDAVRLGTIPPAALRAQPKSAGDIPWAPAVVTQSAPTTAQPAQAQPGGVDLPAPIHAGPEPKPKTHPRALPFHPAGG